MLVNLIRILGLRSKLFVKTVSCFAETASGNVMRLWVQPVDKATARSAVTDEIPIVDSESSRPIVQLDVHVEHYLGKKLVANPQTVFTSLKPCKCCSKMF